MRHTSQASRGEPLARCTTLSCTPLLLHLLIELVSASPFDQAPHVPTRMITSEAESVRAGAIESESAQLESTSLATFSEYRAANLGGGEHPAALVETTGGKGKGKGGGKEKKEDEQKKKEKKKGEMS